MKMLVVCLLFVVLIQCKATTCLQSESIGGYDYCEQEERIVIRFHQEKFVKKELAILGAALVLDEQKTQGEKKLEIRSQFYSDSLITLPQTGLIKTIKGLYQEAKFKALTTYMLDSVSLYEAYKLDVLFEQVNTHKKYIKSNSFVVFMVECFSRGEEVVQEDLKGSLTTSLLVKVKNAYDHQGTEAERKRMAKTIDVLKTLILILDPNNKIEALMEKFRKALANGEIKE